MGFRCKVKKCRTQQRGQGCNDLLTTSQESPMAFQSKGIAERSSSLCLFFGYPSVQPHIFDCFATRWCAELSQTLIDCARSCSVYMFTENVYKLVSVYGIFHRCEYAVYHMDV